MAKPREKSRDRRITEIKDNKKEIRQYENGEKRLRQNLSREERRKHHQRLIIRGAVFESIVPQAKEIIDEEAAALLQLVLTSEPARKFSRE